MSNFFKITTHLVQKDNTYSMLSLRQLSIMGLVYEDKMQGSVKDFARVLKISKPAITRSIDRLEELYLIKRKPDPMDRRTISISPTATGQNFMLNFQ